MSYLRGENTDSMQISSVKSNYYSTSLKKTDRQTDRDIEEEARVNCLYTRRFPFAKLSPKNLRSLIMSHWYPYVNLFL